MNKKYHAMPFCLIQKGKKKPTAKCTMEGLHIIRKSFEDKKNRVLMYKKTCFGHLYDLPNKYKFVSYTVHLLLQRQIGDMKFNVKGTTLSFSELDFATILGLRFRPHPPPLKKECMVSENSIRNRLFKDVKYVKKCHPVERFVSCVDDTDAVKLALIIFLEYYLLGSETHTRVNEHYLELVNNLEEFNKYPWGLVSYKRTTEKLAHGLNNASPRYNLYGCPFAFQAWAFEHIPELANFCAKEHKGIYFPRMMKWQSTKVIHECDTLKNAIFEKPDLKVIERLVLTKEEKQHKFIRDLLLSHVEDKAKKGGAEGHMKMMESSKRLNVEDNNSKEYGEECHMKSQESIKSSNVKDVHNQSLSAQVEICISMLGDISKRLAKVEAWVGSRPHPPHSAKCHEGSSGEYPSHECHQALYKPILGEMSDRLARVEAWMGLQSSQPPPTECHEGTPSKYPSYACIQTPVQPSIGEAPPSVTKRPRRNIISSDILHSSSVNIDVPIGKKVDRTGLKIDPLRALDKKSIEVVKHFSLEKDKGNYPAVEGITISPSFINSILGVRNWLTGSHIDAYMSLLKNRHEKYSYPQSCVFGMVWFMESLVADSTNFHNFSVDPKNHNKSTSEIAKEFKWNSNNLVVASGEKGHPVMWMADRIYLPFNWNNLHWALAVLDPKKRTVYILDSMNFDPWEKYQIQLKAMVEILPSLFHAAGDVEAIYGDKWEIKEVSCPKQENNGNACGIYVLKFVDYLCSELLLDFTQANINYFRRRITLELFEREAKP